MLCYAMLALVSSAMDEVKLH